MPYVLVFFRQSNSRGAGPNSDLHPTLTGQLAGCNWWTPTSNNFTLLQAGVNQSWPTPDNFSGAQMQIMYGWQAYVQQPIYGVIWSVGGTPLYYDGTDQCWYPNVRGTLHDRIKAQFNNALVYMWNTLQLRTGYKFIFIPQGGESDTVNPTVAGQYYPNSVDEITSLLRNVGGIAFAQAPKYFLIPRLSTNQTYDATNLLTIQQAQDALAALDATARIALNTNSQALQGDGHHFTTGGYRTEGLNGVPAMSAAGW